MGANTDTGVGVGKNVEDAFHKLAQERAYDYGHAGYTGTFAETPGAVYFGILPARMTWQKFEKALERQQDLNYRGYWIDRVWKLDERGWRLEVLSETKRTRSPWPKSMQTRQWQDRIARFLAQSNQKWESAAAVRLNAQEERDHKRLVGRRGTRDQAFYFQAMCSS